MPEPTSLRCEMEEASGALVLRLDGQMTFSESELMDKQMHRIMDRRPTRLVLEMSGVRIITSAGIGALLRLNKKLSEQGCKVRLAALQPEMERVLKMARIDHMVPMFPTLAEALAAT